MNPLMNELMVRAESRVREQSFSTVTPAPSNRRRMSLFARRRPAAAAETPAWTAMPAVAEPSLGCSGS